MLDTHEHHLVEDHMTHYKAVSLHHYPEQATSVELNESNSTRRLK